jgi:hypothetical protein
LKHFDPYDLSKANAELQDLVNLLEMSSSEKMKLFSKIRKELSKENITLDCIDNH